MRNCTNHKVCMDIIEYILYIWLKITNIHNDVREYITQGTETIWVVCISIDKFPTCKMRCFRLKVYNNYDLWLNSCIKSENKTLTLETTELFSPFFNVRNKSRFEGNNKTGNHRWIIRVCSGLWRRVVW
jgi:hypothetical protein